MLKKREYFKDKIKELPVYHLAITLSFRKMIHMELLVWNENAHLYFNSSFEIVIILIMFYFIRKYS